MHETYDKSKHYNLLIAENKKNDKKKRVSFSLFQADTFEEIANLRKIRENQLNNFVMSKNKTNELRRSKEKNIKKYSDNSSSFNSNNSSNLFSQIGVKGSNSNNTHSNSLSMGIRINSQESDKKSHTFSENSLKHSKENKEIMNQSIINAEEKKKEDEIKRNILKEKEEKHNKKFEDNKMKKELEEKKKKEIEEKKKKEENDKVKRDMEEKNRKEQEEKKKKEQEEQIQKEIEEKIRKELEEKIRKEQEEKIKKELEEKIKKELEDKLQKEKEEEEKRKQEEEEKKQREEEEKIKLLTLQANTTTFTSILNHLFKHSKSQKQKYFPLLKLCLEALIQENIDKFLNYETDETYYKYITNKINHYLFSKYFSSFLTNTKKKLHKKMLYNYHKGKAAKYLLYRQYKMKALTFSALSSFAIKQKQWINKIRSELSKGLLWSCLDSLKLYVNYKKIKRYFILKKQKRLFDAIVKNNIEASEMDKKAQKVFLIFTYKSFFHKAKRNILITKGQIVNEKIAKEYRKQNLLKKIFNLIYSYYKVKKEKILKSKKRFMVNHENKDYINIQVTQKEVVKFKNNSAIKRVSNKINLV